MKTAILHADGLQKGLTDKGPVALRDSCQGKVTSTRGVISIVGPSPAMVWRKSHEQTSTWWRIAADSLTLLWSWTTETGGPPKQAAASPPAKAHRQYTKTLPYLHLSPPRPGPAALPHSTASQLAGTSHQRPARLATRPLESRAEKTAGRIPRSESPNLTACGSR